MAFTFTLKHALTIPIEVDSVNHAAVQQLSADEVRALPILHGNRRAAVADFFDVEHSSAEADLMVWAGDCSRVKAIGAGLNSGSIRIEGNAGMHLGREMSGGQIHVQGDVADHMATGMRGGAIHVAGNAGDLVGAAWPGSKRGMNGGTILIRGNAGREAGHRMRRGTIVVGGDLGDAAGFDMIAGSLFSFGKIGACPGAGMRRGTIAALNASEEPELLPTFKYSCQYRPDWLSFFLHELSSVGFPVPEDCLNAEYRRYCGDFLTLGKGEVLVRQ
ncbi:MAG: formylmethanofuran dehydrogenase subunit C [Planctomycetaceae bacterium]|nr:formylmethanofuran dehydrogenase subunit C [Planctomycetaceae bacterium]